MSERDERREGLEEALLAAYVAGWGQRARIGHKGPTVRGKYAERFVASCNLPTILARLRATPAPQVERGALVEALEALAEIHWRDGGCSDIPADDFQGVLERHGLLVEVPADEATREAWDTETMLVLAWSSAALEQDDGA